MKKWRLKKLLTITWVQIFHVNRTTKVGSEILTIPTIGRSRTCITLTSGFSIFFFTLNRGRLPSRHAWLGAGVRVTRKIQTGFQAFRNSGFWNCNPMCAQRLLKPVGYLKIWVQAWVIPNCSNYLHLSRTNEKFLRHPLNNKSRWTTSSQNKAARLHIHRRGQKACKIERSRSLKSCAEVQIWQLCTSIWRS